MPRVDIVCVIACVIIVYAASTVACCVCCGCLYRYNSLLYWYAVRLWRYVLQVRISTGIPTVVTQTSSFPQSLRANTWYLFHILHDHLIIKFLSNYHSYNFPTTFNMSTGYGLNDRGVGVWVPVGSRIFSSPRRPDRLWGPSTLLSNGYRDLSPGINWPRHEADPTPPSSAEVKKMWIYTSTPPYAFMS
jgi:hypothetical protein